MRLLDNTWISEDEGTFPEARIAEQIEAKLKTLNLDPYNQQYVIRLTVDKVDAD